MPGLHTDVGENRKHHHGQQRGSEAKYERVAQGVEQPWVAKGSLPVVQRPGIIKCEEAEQLLKLADEKFAAAKAQGEES